MQSHLIKLFSFFPNQSGITKREVTRQDDEIVFISMWKKEFVRSNQDTFQDPFKTSDPLIPFTM